MIHVELERLEFEPTYFHISFVAKCDICYKTLYVMNKRVDTLQRWVVKCSRCETPTSPDTCTFHIKNFILDTVDSLWGYSKEDVKRIEEKLDQYVSVM